MGFVGLGCHELIEFLMKWTDPSQKAWLGAAGVVTRLRYDGHCGAVVLLDDRVQGGLDVRAYMAVPIVSVLPAVHQCQQFWSFPAQP